MTRLMQLKHELHQTQHHLRELEVAAHIVLTYPKDLTLTIREKGYGTYKVTAHGLARSDGGAVAVIYKSSTPWQKPSTSLYNTERFFAIYREGPLLEAVGKVRQAQYTLVNAA